MSKQRADKSRSDDPLSKGDRSLRSPGQPLRPARPENEELHIDDPEPAAPKSAPPGPAVEQFSFEAPETPLARQEEEPDDTPACPETEVAAADEDEDDAFHVRSRKRPGAEEQPKPAREKTTLDRIGTIAAAIILPLLCISAIWVILNKQPQGDQRVFRSSPRTPLSGDLVKITAIESGWRERKESDRVSAQEQILTHNTVYPTRLPQVKLTFDPSKSQSAYLRVLFMNSDGKIAGDSRLVKISNGKVQSTEGGVQVLSDTEAVVTASDGMQSQIHLNDYLAGGQVRWSIELSESADYQARGDSWKTLDTFAIANKEL